MALTTFPIIIPTRGTIKAFLSLILCSNVINKNVPSKEITNANNTFDIVFLPAAKRMEIQTPNRHHSIVPAVDGETNLLFVMVCIINPAILSPAPVIIILRVRGIRLTRAIKLSSEFPVKNPRKLKFCTPVERDKKENINNNKIKVIRNHDRFKYLCLFTCCLFI